MRFVVSAVLAASFGLAGVAIAQTPGFGQTVASRAYTVEPFTPNAVIAIKGDGVRLRAEPFATRETPVLSSGSSGLELTVVGISRQPDWNWYQVVLRNGQKAFIRSDLTSAPSRGGASSPVSQLPPSQPQIAQPQMPQPPVAYNPPPAQTLPPIPVRPSGGGVISLTPSSGAAPLDLPPAANPAPADNGLLSIAPSAPTPRLPTASSSLSSINDHIRAQLDAKRCWTDSSNMMDAQRLRATFAVSFSPSGKFAAEPRLVQPASEPSDDPAMMVFIAKARAALRTCNALGFDVPADYHASGGGDVRLDFVAR